MARNLFLTLLSMLFVTATWAQTQVTGTVTDGESGETLIGVSIIVAGTSSGTVTDFEGKYSIEVPEAATLQFSYTGYATQEIEVGNQSIIDVAMAAGVALDEVVVTSLGMKRDRKALNYSVTQIGGEGFQEARELNLANALAGKVAGVNVSSIASGPAGSSRVIIRGNVSLGANNQPLYVVDGVPIDNSSFGQAGLWGGQDEGDGMSSINPDDIETISVLKGANAAALYGSRASNGVILITTKSGTSRKGIGVEVNSNFVAETFVNPFDFQEEFGHGRDGAAPTSAAEAWDFGNAAMWGSRLDGSSVPQFDGSSRPYVFQTYDNLDRFYETGTTWTNTVSFSGGDENHRVRVNLSDLRSKAITPASGFDRQNVSFSYTGNFGDRITLTSKVLYSHEQAENRPRISDSPGNAFQGLITLPVNYNVDDLRGDPNKLGSVATGNIPPDGKMPGEELQISTNLWNQNPWWAAYQFSNDDTRDRVIASNVARIEITDFLYAQGRFSMDWYTRRETDLTPFGTGYQRKGSMNERERRVREVNIEGIVGFNDTYGDINVDVFFGGNRMRRSSENLNLGGSVFNIPFFNTFVFFGGNRMRRSSENLLGGSVFNIPFFNTFANLSNQGYGISEEGINSVFGSATIGFKDFLYITGTARTDWFSTLNPETNDITYPSIGGSFIFSEILNLPSNSALTFGKIRASWAQVGGDTDPYRLDLTYRLGQGHLGLPNANIQQSSIPNSLLKPLTSTEIEFGFDLRFFNNRLGVDFTYYDQTTTDDILNASIAESSGFNSTTINIGEIKNQGIELLLTGTPIQARNFTWDVSFNMAYNDSEVVSLSEGIDQIRVAGDLGQPRTRWAFIDNIVGERFGTITGFTQEMINGQPVFDPNSGQPVQTNSTSIIGNGVHRFTAGINNSFNFKNFYLDFLIDIKLDGEIYSGTNVRLFSSGLHKQTTEAWTDMGIEANGRESVTVTGVDEEGNPFTKTLDNTEIAGFYGAYSQLSDRFIYDAGFAKLRQLSLGYNFPQSLLSKTPIQSARLSFVARNLFVIFDNVENVDVESTYNNSNAQGLDYYGMPQTRTFGFNLRLGF